jgi:hypothetical protein
MTEESGSFVLTVPMGRLVMTIPKGGLLRVPSTGQGSTNNPRYFLFDDQALHLIISGWFESDHEFSDIRRFWAGETAAQKQLGLPEPQDVRFETIGSWKAIIYDIALPGNGNSHIRAECVQAGTWIDAHLSLTSELPQKGRRARLREILEAIRISEKKPDG